MKTQTNQLNKLAILIVIIHLNSCCLRVSQYTEQLHVDLKQLFDDAVEKREESGGILKDVIVNGINKSLKRGSYYELKNEIKILF